MDGFTDSLSQHFSSPQDMINANSQAEAEEMDNLKDQIGKYEGVLEKLNETVSAMDRSDGDLQEHIHKENVRVYRNVQAAFIEELAKQNSAIDQKLDNIAEELEGRIDAQFDARLGTKFDEKLQELKRLAEDKSAFKNKAVLPLQIIIFIAVIADLAINVLKILGIL